MSALRSGFCLVCDFFIFGIPSGGKGRARLRRATRAAAPITFAPFALAACAGAGDGAYGSDAPVVPTDQGAPTGEQLDRAVTPRSEATEVVFEGKLKPPLGLEASVTLEGVWLSTSSGPVATGCLRLGDGVSIPTRNDVQDKPGITACARRLKRARAEFGLEKSVTVYGLASLKYETVIQVIDALRGDEDEELFPDVTVAVKR